MVLGGLVDEIADCQTSSPGSIPRLGTFYQFFPKIPNFEGKFRPLPTEEFGKYFYSVIL